MPVRRRPGKRQNGAGNSITLNFDQSDPQELAALHMARRLAAMKHGRRKDLIIALLSAMEQHYAATGEILTPVAVTNALLQAAPTPLAGQGRVLEIRSVPAPRPPVQVVTGGDSRADAKAVASSFASSLAGFLG